MKLGKQQKRDDPRNFRLAKYLVREELPLPPERVDWSPRVATWPMFMNDAIGSCAIASAAHLIELWTGNSATPVILDDDEVVKAYSDIGGYDPGDPSTDGGCVMLDVLKHWRKVGIGTHKILAFAEVNPRDAWEMQMALWLFGGLYCGYALPHSAATGLTWDITVDDGGLWGGHAVGIVQSDPTEKTCITWGDKKVMSNDFHRRYCDESYVILSTDWISESGLSPSGFNLDALKNDLLSL